tara:strand:+ start:301 stop:768 length:468 start_codon:yes stop_codon:yes gene_type:complete
MLEVAVAVSTAASAYKGIKEMVEAGREIQDCYGMFAKFFDAKESLTERQQYADNPSTVAKLLSGNSVEAQALEVTAAKHKVKALETQLKEFLIYSGQSDFYEDMMRERRVIRQQRLRVARDKAIQQKQMIDAFMIVSIIGLLGVLAGTIIFIFSL